MNAATAGEGIEKQSHKAHNKPNQLSQRCKTFWKQALCPQNDHLADITEEASQTLLYIYDLDMYASET